MARVVDGEFIKLVRDATDEELKQFIEEAKEGNDMKMLKIILLEVQHRKVLSTNYQ